MKRLRMDNGEVRDDPDPPEHCPECGRKLADIEQRGDVLAYVHADASRRDCLS